MAEELNFIVLDVETGGLKAGVNPVIEIGLICYNGEDLQEMFRWSTYIKNDRNLKIEPAVSSAEAVKQMIECFQKGNPTKKAKLKPIICGHNIAFDMGMIDDLVASQKEDIFKYISEIQYDTMTFARTVWIGTQTLPNYQLATVVEKAGSVLNNAHTAMGDVEATADVVKMFIKRLRSEGGVEGGSNTSFRKTFEF